MKNKKKVLLTLVSLTIGFILFFYWQNNSITTHEIEFKNSDIPEAFEGFKILHLSDLHNKEFGTKQDGLLTKIEHIDPDLIVITGDLIDSNRPNLDIAMDLIKEAINIAPIYYVSGNHEAWSGLYDELKNNLEANGVIVLDNQADEFHHHLDSIRIVGLSDPSFTERDWKDHNDSIPIEDTLSNLIEDDTTFTILLSHRPELFEWYSKEKIDLVFSGHAHGGQIRIPFMGGLIAPNQGLFPSLTEGIHTKNNTSLIISRGLGNSIIPVRVFNSPELIVVTLSKNTK
ncbi:metallophosphoesterase [Jeotgalibaca sp. MA1X17-3]|uniref:metallophosphoesterase n=1 Tax=Jeotgalibaca sp. MA1X17-3 TaxID=2908211 RepID=UPI001F1AF814|nr:metallophosphoesterase [Jeotgalibaca sp. MA1X17-3]UJF16512.1 metallophosphoesterase [Jeotgalibaca sp. MA1X17-3]